MKFGDIMILTADHGCDPTWTGTDHTRERVPVLVIAQGFAGKCIGVRPTFADIGESVAAWLGLPPGPHGTSFLPFAAQCLNCRRSKRYAEGWSLS